MATYLDHPYQGTPYVSGVPVDLIVKVGMSKQAKYDTNTANIQSQLDRINDYNIVRDSDKQVIASKLADTVDKLNGLSGDLSDSRVYNQLSGISSALSNDPDVYTRIADNQRANKAVSQMNDMVEKDPDTYNEANAHVFNKKYQSWLNTPNSKFNASYTPFDDVQKKTKDIVEMSLKNPDIIREATYVKDKEGNLLMGPDGNPMKRSDSEIKQVLASKLKEQIRSGLDSKAINQLMIDREYQNDQIDPKQLVVGIGSQIDEFKSQLKGVTARINTATMSDRDRADATTLQSRLKDLIPKYESMQSKIATTGDVGQYYTPEKYIDDFTSSTAKSWQMRQEGKADDDFIFTEDYKFQHQKELETLKDTLETTQKFKLAEAGIGKDGKKTKTGSELPESPFENNFVNLFTKGKASFGSNEVASMFNNDPEVQKDGSFNIVLHSQPMFPDVQPTLQALGMDIPVAKADGLNQWNTALTEYTNSHPNNSPKGVPNKGQFQWMGNPVNTVGDVPANEINYNTEFLKTPSGKAKAAEIKANTGFDPSNPEDKAYVEKLAKNPLSQNLMSQVSTMFSKAKLGNVNVVPMDGENVFAGSDGKMYTKVLATMNKRQLINAFGDNFEILMDKGFLTRISDKNDSPDKVMYQMPIVTEVKKDPRTMNMQYMNKTYSGKEYAELIPGMNHRFDETYNTLKEVQDIMNVPPDQIATAARTNLGKLPISTELNREITSRIAKYNAELNSNPSQQSRVAILKNLRDIIRWDGVEAPNMATALSNPLEAVIAPGSRASYELTIKNIKHGIAGVEQGAKGYQSVNDSSGAMGKYQFLESTLKNEVFNKYYKSKYDSFSDFKKEFMKSPDLQEKIMDQWIMDKGPESNYNPYRFALTHFLGGGGVSDLVSGRISWDKSPTSGPNATPTKYLTTFASNFNQ